MEVMSQPALNHFSHIKISNPVEIPSFTAIPEIDLSNPEAKNFIVKACEDFGFFKVVNHEVPLEFMMVLENEALNFFNLPQSEKDEVGPPDPFGYGSKEIGPNGDAGWIEYLLLNTNPEVASHKSTLIFQKNPEIFRSAVNKYIALMKSLACQALELIAEGLGIEEKNGLSRLLMHEKSDSCFRFNHYPPCEEAQGFSGRTLIGFGEHTDPQIISVLRSNNTTGLQICLKDGSWLSVPPDHSSFFVNVGDALQVMTNGRFKSVKHKVVIDNKKSRVSIIYFGGPPLSEKIAPLPSLLKKEVSLYKEFTWGEYKRSAYETRLADHRLGLFEKSAEQAVKDKQKTYLFLKP